MKKTQLIIIAAVIIVIGGTFLLWFLLGDKSETTNENTNAAVQAQTEFTYQDAKVELPTDSVSTPGEVKMSIVPADQAPAPPEGEYVLGDVYDVTTTAILKSGQPAFLTLEFDPLVVPADFQEEFETTGMETNAMFLYLARYNGSEWESVPGVVIDLDNNTATAPVTEFSFFSFLFNPFPSILQTDMIIGIERFADLPDDVKQDLDPQYAQSDIKSGLTWMVSPLSRLASQTILGANFVNKISGGILAMIEGGEDLVYEWIAEELIKEIGHDVLAAAVGEEAADFAITLYDTATLGAEVYSAGFEAVKNAPMLQAKIAAQILSYQMDYINKNLDQAYSDIATLNLWSFVTTDEPLIIVVVAIDGENKQAGNYDRGLKFYYYNDSDEEWVNYANSAVAMKVSDVNQTGTTSTNTNTSINTNTTANTNTTTNTNTSTGLSGCLDIDLSSGDETYDVTKGNGCTEYDQTATTSSYGWKCSSAYGSWRGTWVKEVDLSGTDTATVKADLGLTDHAGLFTSTCSGAKGVHYANYVRLTVHDTDPRDTLDTECAKSIDEAWTSCAMRETDADVIGWCGVPECETSETCSFDINVPTSGKVYLVFTISDAWDYADVDGTLDDLQICSTASGSSDSGDTYARARDSSRLSDISMLRAGLSVYYMDYLEYPSSLSALVPDYMTEIPENPSPGGMDYTYSGSEDDFTLKYKLEVGNDSVSAGTQTATPDGIY